MIYLLKGDDYRAKETKIDELKKKFLVHPDAPRFDFDNLNAEKLAPAELKKSLVSLPAVNPHRLVFIRNIQKANEQNQKILVAFFKEKPEHCIVIGDMSAPSQKGFITQLAKMGQKLEFGTGKKITVWEMTDQIKARNSKEALRLLSQMIKDGSHPLQIMGGLVWFWGRMKTRIPARNFQQGLQELQIADLNIKRSRLQPDHAVQILVTKLCLLAA